MRIAYQRCEEGVFSINKQKFYSWRFNKCEAWSRQRSGRVCTIPGPEHLLFLNKLFTSFPHWPVRVSGGDRYPRAVKQGLFFSTVSLQCGTNPSSAGCERQSDDRVIWSNLLTAVASLLKGVIPLSKEVLKHNCWFWHRSGTKASWEIIFTASLRMNNDPSPASALLPSLPLVDAHVTEPQDRLDAAPPAAVCLSFFPLLSYNHTLTCTQKQIQSGEKQSSVP